MPKYFWIALALAVFLLPVSLHTLDVPLAVFCAHLRWPVQSLGNHFGSAVLVSGEAVVVAGLILFRLVSGRLANWARMTVIACGVSLSAYALCDVALKMVFGMPNPADVLAGAPHAFRFLQGNWQSSFPSGHMALACGFTATFMGQDRRLLWTLVAGTALAGLLLVAGNWHFLSDVIAGALVGSIAGVTAAKLWAQHLVDVRRG